ncbi:MAG: hypothetical protein ABSF93_10135, partial [Candidatus Sulfotelmatobacter sp.]
RPYSKDKRLSTLRKTCAGGLGQLASFPPRETKNDSEKKLGDSASNEPYSQQPEKRENLTNSPNTANRKRA